MPSLYSQRLERPGAGARADHSPIGATTSPPRSKSLRGGTGWRVNERNGRQACRLGLDRNACDAGFPSFSPIFDWIILACTVLPRWASLPSFQTPACKIKKRLPRSRGLGVQALNPPAIGQARTPRGTAVTLLHPGKCPELRAPELGSMKRPACQFRTDRHRWRLSTSARKVDAALSVTVRCQNSRIRASDNDLSGTAAVSPSVCDLGPRADATRAATTRRSRGVDPATGEDGKTRVFAPARRRQSQRCRTFGSGARREVGRTCRERVIKCS